MRIPAADLERMVVRAIIDRLQDSSSMQPWLSQRIPIADVPARLKVISRLATSIGSNTHDQSEQIRKIIEKVTVSKLSIIIQISGSQLGKAVGIASSNVERADQPNVQANQEHDPGEIALRKSEHINPLTITITSHLLRCGRQVKLILGNDSNETATPIPQLVAMVAKTRRWFEGLKSGRYPTIKDIALEEKCDKSYVGRLLSIAFLAPDIVERVLTGNHSSTLTPERLRKASPLPLGWEEQRAPLLN